MPMAVNCEQFQDTKMVQNDKGLFARRSDRCASQLGRDAIVIILTASVRPRSRDSDFPYRQDSYCHWLTGFTQPNDWLILTGDGRSTLFYQTMDVEPDPARRHVTDH
jgi:Xaa-Pro aminopeptidase